MFGHIALAGALLALVVTPAIAGAFEVKGATLTASPTMYEGPCPATITFNGTIAAFGKGQVQYTFLRSDGGQYPTYLLDFAGPDITQVKGISTTWKLGGASLPSYSGWMAVKIISPNALESTKAEFAITCTKAKPDLIVVESGSGIGDFGKNWYIFFQVKNIGTVGAGPSQLKLECQPAAKCATMFVIPNFSWPLTWNIPSLPAGSASLMIETPKFKFSSPPVTYQLTATADALAQVAEQNENNNALTLIKTK